MTSPAGGRSGDRVYRVHWVPGTDILHGTCHCGAERLADEPVALWEWLLGHPQGHGRASVPASRPPGRLTVPA